MIKEFLIKYREETDSTNTWAKQLAYEGAPEGTVTVADSQSAGRGRRGRVWISPPGTAVYMSVILRPKILPGQASMLTLVMGLAVAKVCRTYLGLDAKIKWPNDVVVNGKKVCGILTEMNLLERRMDSIVVGVGININQMDFPEEICDVATSLALEKGEVQNRNAVRDEVLKTFEEDYRRFLETGDMRLLQEEYEACLVNLNRQVQVLEPTGAYSGIARGINEIGELIVEKEDGSREAVYAGEVSVRGVYGYV